MKLRTMIIDDEPFVRDDLRYMLDQDPDVEVVAEAAKVAEARELIAERHPDLIFLDVELRGGSGFELLSDIAPGTHVVFITAHGKHAEKARRFDGVEFLMKPISHDSLCAIIDKEKRAFSGKP